MAAVNVKMALLHVLVAFVLLNISVTTIAEDAAGPTKKNDCEYCLDLKDRDIKQRVSDFQVICGCFEGKNSSICSVFASVPNNSNAYNYLVDFCRLVVKPIAESFDKCSLLGPGDTITRKSDDFKNSTDYPTSSTKPSTLNSTDYPTSSTKLSTLNSTDYPTSSTKPSTLNSTDYPTSSTKPSTLSSTDYPTSSTKPSTLNSTDYPTSSTKPSTLNSTDYPTSSTKPSTLNSTDYPTSSTKPSTLNSTDYPTSSTKPSTLSSTDYPTSSTKPSTLNSTDYPTSSTNPSTLNSTDYPTSSTKPVTDTSTTIKIKDTPDSDAAGYHNPGGEDKLYPLAAILWSIFLAFGAGILIAVIAKMFYNRYRRDSYVLPPEQGAH